MGNFFQTDDKNTFIFGNNSNRVKSIYISNKNQFANNDFKAVFHRFNSVNDIKNSDVMNFVLDKAFNSQK